MSGGGMGAAPAPAPDDSVLPFAVEALDVRGRVVRLGPLLDDILGRHAYPAPVSRLLAEAIALTLLLGSNLKFEGRFILQTRTDGPVDLIVVDFTAPDRVRAVARFDAERLALYGKAPSAGVLLGKGHLAMTIDQGSAASRYQGLVALEGGGFEEAAHQYFLRSEQIPTRVRLAVAEELAPGEGGPSHRWRAGGALVQFLPADPRRARVADLDPGDAPQGTLADDVSEDDAWVEARALAETVTDLELVDPEVSAERLLYRLFHERGVRVFDPLPMRAECSCSRDRVRSMLMSFPDDDRRHMVEGGRIHVTCEFCARGYDFAPAEVDLPPD